MPEGAVTNSVSREHAPSRRCWLAASLVALTVLAVSGCGGRVPGAGAESEATGPDIVSEAYLFDTFIYRAGKRTSVRLELLATDSILAAGGRAYLGKGALKGWIRDDSLKIYFPQSDEYVYEPLRNLMQSVDCHTGSPDLRLLDLFFHTPDSVALDSLIRVSEDWSEPNRPSFQLTVADCPWRFELVYDRREAGFRPRELRFDNGDDLQIEAKRREYRDRVTVKKAKFALSIPGSAIQIAP